MSSTSSADPTAPAARGERVVQCAITINAPPSAVWQALTDPTELMRWFPHRGANRQTVWVRKAFTGSHAAVWARLTGSGGWFGPAGLPALVPEERYATRTAAGDLLEGRAELWE